MIGHKGYVQVLMPGHRLSTHTHKNYADEHRIVFEEYHKCCLLPWCNIHHINGIKTDNRPENLRGVTKAQHNRLHMNRDPLTGRFLKTI